ncbi:MAG TPA: hypothetical protein ENN66_12235 [Proteobacteria bacterium]|nr:hypothetical protein [Pseudomonadota bacterium]
MALYALSREGREKAREIAAGLSPAEVFFPERLGSPRAGETSFAASGLGALVEKNWAGYAGHIFITAAGIAVRQIAPLLKNKTCDPAVVVCAENGSRVISLVGGHIAGANRLARRIAGITGGEAVITTATDSRDLMAFDELAALSGWRVENPSRIKIFNAALLEARPLDLLLPEAVFERYYAAQVNLRRLGEPAEIQAGLAVVLDPPPDWAGPDDVEILVLRSRSTL